MTMLRAVTAVAQGTGLFEQSASVLLLRQFGGANLSWLLLDRFGRIAALHGFESDRAVAPGSLLKPFVASAYGEQHDNRYPKQQCNGTRDHCWYPNGHGMLGLEEAVAQSCNAYFLGLARGLEHNRALLTFQRFGFEGATPAVTAPDMIGLTAVWRETPLTIGVAYQKLLNDRISPYRDRIMTGMEAAAAHGTARAAGLALGAHTLLAKTGTASCSHHPQGMADGFAVLLYPAAQPRVLLLVRHHGATGAETSGQAGAMLRALELGTA
jgi:cell division protein FtsI/penicillin-binding protein 2